MVRRQRIWITQEGLARCRFCADWTVQCDDTIDLVPHDDVPEPFRSALVDNIHNLLDSGRVRHVSNHLCLRMRADTLLHLQSSSRWPAAVRKSARRPDGIVPGL